MSVFDTFVARCQTLVDFLQQPRQYRKSLTERNSHFQLI